MATSARPSLTRLRWLLTSFALVTDIKGTVEVSRTGETTFRAADWGSQLFEGDRVRTGPDSETSLLFASGNIVSLDGGSTMTISAATTSAPSLSGPVREARGDLLAAVSDRFHGRRPRWDGRGPTQRGLRAQTVHAPFRHYW